MLINRQSIAQVLSDLDVMEGIDRASLALKGVMLAHRLGITPEEVTSILLFEYADELALWESEYIKRHDQITGHDAGQCSGKLK